MANARLIKVLENYTGDAQTLEAFVKVATEELGTDWISTIYDVMADAPADIQERLTHAFNYNAAMTAWNELQEYLLQETPLDYQETMERVRYYLDRNIDSADTAHLAKNCETPAKAYKSLVKGILANRYCLNNFFVSS